MTSDTTVSDPGWQAAFETIRIRLGDFLRGGTHLDLDNIVAVRFEFGGAVGSTQGRIAVDDVEFTSAALTVDPCPAVDPCHGPGCVQATELSSVDTELHRCQPTTGPPLDCLSQTVHVVTNACADGACCTANPPCLCPEQPCPNGTRIECR